MADRTRQQERNPGPDDDATSSTRDVTSPLSRPGSATPDDFVVPGTVNAGSHDLSPLTVPTLRLPGVDLPALELPELSLPPVDLSHELPTTAAELTAEERTTLEFRLRVLLLDVKVNEVGLARTAVAAAVGIPVLVLGWRWLKLRAHRR